MLGDPDLIWYNYNLLGAAISEIIVIRNPAGIRYLIRQFMVITFDQREMENRRILKTITGGRQMSEAFILSAVLAFAGGFQDAYTYIDRGRVFANAQTGNIVLMSTHFMAGEGVEGLHYLLPLLSFAAGVFCAERVESCFKYARKLHWRQGVLLAEMLILVITGFIPEDLSTLANVLVSFSCAMQVQTFRKVNGNSYASTMCIGNLRSGTAALSAFLRDRRRGAISAEENDIRRVLYYFGVILIFAVGAGIGGNVSDDLGLKAIWVSAVFLGIGFLLMELDRGTCRVRD